jgi:thioredoxin 1
MYYQLQKRFLLVRDPISSHKNSCIIYNTLKFLILNMLKNLRAPVSLTKGKSTKYNYLVLVRRVEMSEGITEATTATWEKEVLNTSGLIMIDFWAVWCGPCRIIAPTVEELAKEYSGKVKVMKLNTDENPDIASRYKIMGIPTLMFFKDGQKVDQIVGAVPKPQLKAKIESLLSS